MKKMVLIIMAMAMVLGFTGMASATPPCPNCPTEVMNIGGSTQWQGNTSLAFKVKPVNVAIQGHGQLGVNGNFISLKNPGNTNGLAVNGNVFNQGFTKGAGKVWTGVGVSDYSLDTMGEYKETSTDAHLGLKVKGGAKFTPCDTTGYVNGKIDASFDYHNAAGSWKEHTREMNFGAGSGGSLKAPGEYQGQAGFNYTKVVWGDNRPQ